ncbi:hypothetical protein GCM10010967_47190 [Dyadobacter beijingensis]|uniref:Uncharacterized protein n=1 Tax=Dyadobacter beijingensis TaxID=365489 RepID=A0ABQ2IEE5_9BACT|nr:hypothetical protein GCM10010967_47190 [Dyadobacter beijingensis]
MCFHKVFRQASTDFTDSGPGSDYMVTCAKDGDVVVLAFDKADILIGYRKELTVKFDPKTAGVKVGGL